MEQPAQLLICPFCGGTASLSVVGPGAYVVACSNQGNGLCPIGQMADYLFEADAVGSWNQRSVQSETVPTNQLRTCPFDGGAGTLSVTGESNYYVSCANNGNGCPMAAMTTYPAQEDAVSCWDCRSALSEAKQ